MKDSAISFIKVLNNLGVYLMYYVFQNNFYKMKCQHSSTSNMSVNIFAVSLMKILHKLKQGNGLHFMILQHSGR